MRTNVAVKTPPIHTHGGSVAVRVNAIQQLRRSVMSCMLWEDTFYESGVEIGKRIHEEVAEVLKLKDGAGIVGNIAYEARTKFKLRHAPLWLIVALICAKTDEARAVVGGAIATCVQRPDEMAELIAMYWKGGKNPLTAQMKKGLAAAFQKFDRYSLSKYANRDGQVAMRDVLFLVHAKPLNDEQAGLWKELAEGNLKAPDTWESNLSAGKDKKETFTRLIAEKQLGALALLRNLRNMQEAKVEPVVIREALSTMKTERVLPFRFVTAAKYAPKLEPELEGAMFRCLEGSTKLSGKTLLVVDCSGSMHGQISGKSELDRLSAATALAMLLREVCEDVVIYATAGSDSTRKHATMLIPPRRGFGLRDLLKYENTTRTIGGGGIFLKQVIDFLRDKESDADRIVVFTDEQDCDLTNKPGSAKPFGKDNYLINVGADRNGIGYGDWVHIDGFSEATLDFIQQHEIQQ
jgi:60 kDa SS-A/Ro ribonucleoprotein